MEPNPLLIHEVDGQNEIADSGDPLDISYMGNAELENYRERLKEDPEKWSEYLERQKIRGRLYRARKSANMTPAELEEKRRQDRERKRLQRSRQRLRVLALSHSVSGGGGM